MQEPENESGFVVRDKRHSSFEDSKETTEPGESSGGVSTATDDPKPEQIQEPEMKRTESSETCDTKNIMDLNGASFPTNIDGVSMEL